MTVALVAFSRRAAVEAVYPLERLSLVIRRGVLPRVTGFFSAPSLAAENARLRREVAELSLAAGEARRLREENARLRDSLGFLAREPERWIAAPVLTDHGGAVGRGHRLRIGRGRSDGVVPGAIAAAADGLVGRVEETTAHTAVVILLTDPSLKVACSVELGGGRTASGILEGGGGEALALTHIRGLAADAPGARVFSSGRGGVFPKGFDVGTLVASVARETGEWSGTVRPSVDFDVLEDVFISREK